MNLFHVSGKALILWILLALIESHAALAQKTGKDKPNIIFILTDDLGWGDVGIFYQNERKKVSDKSEPWMFTPHLDQLADQGAQLLHHYCAAPVCAPSRASLLLGVSQGHANVRDNQFDKALEDNHTIATVLRQAGYTTAAIGKWGLQGDNRWDENGSEWPAHPLNRGFDYFLGYMRHVDGHEHYPKEGIYRGAKEVWENRINIAEKLDKCYTTDLWTAAAKRWIMQHIRARGKEQPFFMYLAYDTPHAVLELPTQAYPAGGGIKGGLQWLDEPGRMINTASEEVDSWIHPDYVRATYDHDRDALTPEVEWPDTYKRYASLVRRIDSGVGDIMALLKDLDIDSNTLIVFTSDNGPSLESYLGDDHVTNTPDFFNSFGPFDGVKRDCWEGGVRMPTIARWPARIPAKKIISDPSASYDWLPTFTDAAGSPAPARTDGVSLLPSLTGQGKQRESMVYVEYFNNGATPDFPEFDPAHRDRRRNQMQMIRIGDYVGVRYNIESHEDDFEIYNIAKDPSETRNLAHTPGMDSFQQRMKERVLQVRRPDPSARRPYDNELISPLTLSKDVVGGVRWSLHTGHFPWVPDVTGLNASRRGTADRPDMKNIKSPGRKRDQQVVCFEGYIRIPEDGEYTFHLRASGSLLLRVHRAIVIDADHLYNSGRERKGKVLLKAGYHPFTLSYRAGAEEKSVFDFQWEGGGIMRQEIPAEVFFHD